MAITYVHDDSETTVDGFTIQLTDGKHQLRKRVEVMVLPINDELPHIIRYHLCPVSEKPAHAGL